MKKLFGAILASLMVLNATGSLMTIHAHESTVNKLEIHECEDCDNTIEPRVVIKKCLQCTSVNTYITYTGYTPWQMTSETNCIHYTYGKDVKQERTATYSVTCNTCGYVALGLKETQTRTQCRGYN